MEWLIQLQGRIIGLDTALDLAEQYRNIVLDQENLITLPVTAEIAEVAAQLRANHNLRTPDAIQLATALQGEATFFLTNDACLAAVPDLDILILDSLAGK